MMKSRMFGASRFAWLLTVCSLAAAQTVPPEVLLLARIKSHMREELDHLPNYTCLETISRFRREPSVHSKTALKPLDIVRLEIVYGGHHEWYGSPEARNLSADNPAELVGSGMIGTGAFGITLHNVFEAATFHYQGEQEVAGRNTVLYDFQLPRLLKGLTISILGGSGTVGEEGSVWADPQSRDLIRLESRATDIPPYLPLHSLTMEMQYGRTRIGSENVLLPQQGSIHMLETSGTESYDRLDFTHCRAFTAQSSIRFDSDPPAPAASNPVAAPAPIQTVPALLLVTVQLARPITSQDAVGTLISGRIAGDVVRKGKVVIPSGSPVRGRIRRLERFAENSANEFIVGLEFTEIEVNGEPMRFYADLLRIDRSPVIRRAISERILVRNNGGEIQNQESTITLSELPGVASFFVSGTSFIIPAGYAMAWRTRGVLH